MKMIKSVNFLSRPRKSPLTFFTVIFIHIFILTLLIQKYWLVVEVSHGQSLTQHSFTDSSIFKYESLSDEIRHLPIIFVGGYYRSGTTLLRAILDVHPNISCGPETNIILAFLNYIKDYQSQNRNQVILKEAGLITQQKNTVDDAARAFLFYLLRFRYFESGNETVLQTKPRLCTKEPEVLTHMIYLHKIFPNAKFIHIYRDGRAAAHSYMLHRSVNKKHGFKNFLPFFNRWNSFVKQVNADCKLVGPEKCMMIKYEELVTSPRPNLDVLMSFLDEKWTDELLKHHEHLEDVAVSDIEWSTNQIKKEIHNESISYHVWLDQMPDYNAKAIDTTMLRELNYDTTIGMIEKNRNY